jgi:ATP-dependent DNA helicase RecG
MESYELKALIGKGETNTIQFKAQVNNEISIAQEMIAFANSRGGTMLIGIDNASWEIQGLSNDDLRRLSNLMVNAANEHVKPPIFIETDTIAVDGKKVMIIKVPEGNNKPYKDKDGIIFLKNGANKRKVTSNDEILRLHP